MPSILITCIEGNEDALALGGVLADWLSAKPVAVHVLPWPDYMLGDDAGLAFERRADRVFTIARNHLPNVETRVVHSHSVVEGLLEAANHGPGGVIVVGAGNKSWDWLWPHSVASSLLEHCRAAVAVVPPGYAANAGAGIGRVGIAVEATECSQETVAVGARIAGRANARISLFIAGGSHDSAPDQVPFLEAAAWSDSAQLEQHKIEGQFLRGLLAARDEVDLLVVGPRCGRIRRMLRRSTTDHLIRKPPCPVLVVTNYAAADTGVPPKPAGE